MSAAALIGDQIVLEELYDETYIPTEQGTQGRNVNTGRIALGIAEHKNVLEFSQTNAEVVDNHVQYADRNVANRW